MSQSHPGPVLIDENEAPRPLNDVIVKKVYWENTNFVRLYMDASTKKIWQSNLNTCVRLDSDLA